MRAAGDSRHADAVLVWDEDVLVRDIIAELAAAEGLRALPVAGEEEARLVIATYPGRIRFLILDLRLASGDAPPEAGGAPAVLGDGPANLGDGFALGGRLASLRPGMRILYLSSHPREDFRESGSLRGQDVFLAKPFQSESLRDLIRAAPAAPGA